MLGADCPSSAGSAAWADRAWSRAASSSPASSRSTSFSSIIGTVVEELEPITTARPAEERASAGRRPSSRATGPK
ncbi:hypothetical protein [Kitasatospora sp. CB02891]|uniref:hypothetical protein n=1 Tax=Kitasatospora sp. CB02891 TaxID=2020329 RepID=UPI001E3A4B88|nr:hypothetical protein [Kitasatospora sp. CB02891]